MNTPLSREAMAVLELLPQWQLRAHLRPASAAAWGAQCKVLIVAVVASEIEKRFWANVGKALHALGLPQQLWSDAQLLTAEQIEAAVERVMQDQPGTLLVFGESLKKSLLGFQPDLEGLCKLQCLPSVSECINSGKQKRRLFASLLEFKREAT